MLTAEVIDVHIIKQAKSVRIKPEAGNRLLVVVIKKSKSLMKFNIREESRKKLLAFRKHGLHKTILKGIQLISFIFHLAAIRAEDPEVLQHF